jgi:hypothetical protein
MRPPPYNFASPTTGKKQQLKRPPAKASMSASFNIATLIHKILFFHFITYSILLQPQKNRIAAEQPGFEPFYQAARPSIPMDPRLSVLRLPEVWLCLYDIPGYIKQG